MSVELNDRRYANWKAPAEDGQLLIWPAAGDVVQGTIANHRLLSESQALIQNVPLRDLRRAQRKWLGHADNQRPMIGTGHQSELYHPGVWVKDAMMHAAVSVLGGSAYHFAVDTDQPKHLNVRWPGTTIVVTDDPAVTSAQWCGLVAPPTPAHLQGIADRLGKAEQNWNFTPMLGRVLDTLRRTSLESATSSTETLSGAITNAQHELDWELGLRHHAVIVSPMLMSGPYLAFVHHILSRAGEFARDYNAALGAYRVEAGIRSNMRPMPDLAVSETAVEVPFWLDDLVNGSRQRAEVRRQGDAWIIGDEDRTFRFETSADAWSAADQLLVWLRREGLRLSPRALTLTTFLRLFVVDQLVHGIGGGRYDQVTDRVIARHFGLEPPRFAVTTATLFFPQAVGRSRACLSCLAQEGHQIRHGLLGEKKERILAELNALPRRSIKRLMVFQNMHGALSAATIDHPRIAEWEQRYREAEQQDREDEVIFDRELFYAIQPKERLIGMIGRYVQEFENAK